MPLNSKWAEQPNASNYLLLSMSFFINRFSEMIDVYILLEI